MNLKKKYTIFQKRKKILHEYQYKSKIYTPKEGGELYLKKYHDDEPVIGDLQILSIEECITPVGEGIL